VGGMKMGEVHRNFTHKKKTQRTMESHQKKLVSSDSQTTR